MPELLRLMISHVMSHLTVFRSFWVAFVINKIVDLSQVITVFIKQPRHTS